MGPLGRRGGSGAWATAHGYSPPRRRRSPPSGALGRRQAWDPGCRCLTRLRGRAKRSGPGRAPRVAQAAQSPASMPGSTRAWSLLPPPHGRAGGGWTGRAHSRGPNHVPSLTRGWAPAGTERSPRAKPDTVACPRRPRGGHRRVRGPRSLLRGDPEFARGRTPANAKVPWNTLRRTRIYRRISG